jgi:hypothetical protein
VLTNMDTGKQSELYADPDGHVTLRLPKGRYDAFAFVDTGTRRSACWRTRASR